MPLAAELIRWRLLRLEFDVPEPGGPVKMPGDYETATSARISPDRREAFVDVFFRSRGPGRPEIAARGQAHCGLPRPLPKGAETSEKILRVLSDASRPPLLECVGGILKLCGPPGLAAGEPVAEGGARARLASLVIRRMGFNAYPDYDPGSGPSDVGLRVGGAWELRHDPPGMDFDLLAEGGGPPPLPVQMEFGVLASFDYLTPPPPDASRDPLRGAMDAVSDAAITRLAERLLRAATLL